MARLRQLYPQNYSSSGNINAELESVIRYLNAAELGNKTLGELLTQLFDDDGNFDGPIEMRKDADGGIEYRVGTFTNDEDGWQSLVSLDEIRGSPGRDIGDIGSPLLYGRADYAPAAGVTTLDYSFVTTDAVLVFKDGLLLREGGSFDYTLSLTGGTGGTSAVVFNSPLAGTEKISLFKVRTQAVSGYTRQDTVTTSSQTVFPFVHDESSVLLVYKNGVLQRSGGSFDYVTNAATDTVTFTAAQPTGTLISIMMVENALTRAVTGLMLEERFCNLLTGLIKWSKIGVADGEIAQAKVNGLVALATAAARITVSGTTPASPSAGHLWVDTSATPNQLRFWDGVQWLRTTPSSSLPAFATSDALYVLRVNGTGTGLEFAAVDLSSVIPLTQRGAANGVATLDSSSKIPAAQLPAAISRFTSDLKETGALANGTKRLQRFWNQKIVVDSVSARLSAGTATGQLAINGVAFGSTFPISTTPNEIKLGVAPNVDSPQQVDTLSASKTVDIIITANSAGADLDVAVGGYVVPS